MPEPKLSTSSVCAARRSVRLPTRVCPSRSRVALGPRDRCGWRPRQLSESSGGLGWRAQDTRAEAWSFALEGRRCRHVADSGARGHWIAAVTAQTIGLDTAIAARRRATARACRRTQAPILITFGCRPVGDRSAEGSGNPVRTWNTARLWAGAWICRCISISLMWPPMTSPGPIGGGGHETDGRERRLLMQLDRHECVVRRTKLLV